MSHHKHLDGLNQEISDHIAAEVEENLARGMRPDEARRNALIRFGNQAAVREETYNVWHLIWFQQAKQDTRYAVRTLLRNRGFAATVILTLALAIGMNTAVFSVIEAVLLRPLPYPQPQRLVWLAAFARDYQPQNDNLVSRADYSIWSERTKTLDMTAGYGNQDLALIANGEAFQERILSFTGKFWELTGASTQLGRLPGPGEAHAMDLSDALFKRRFHSDPRVLGETVTLNGFPMTIVGVLKSSYNFVLPQQTFHGDEARPIDAYIPIPQSLMTIPIGGTEEWQELIKRLGPAPYYLDVIGRLSAGVSIVSARTEMDALHTRIINDHSSYLHDYDNLQGWRISLLQDKLAGSARRALSILLASVLFVLLIASANIANLLLARAATRKREIAIRASMGAGRMRVVRQFIVESLILSLLGGASGLVLAQAAITGMIRVWPQAIPRLSETRLDGPVLLVTLAISCSTGILFGLTPAILLWGGNLYEALKESSQTASASSTRTRIRKVLISMEVALAIVLLTGAGLMLKSFWQMNVNASGFKPESILTMRVTLAGQGYSTWTSQEAYIRTVLEKLTAYPGVESAGIDSAMLHTDVKTEGLSSSTRTTTPASVRAVSIGYLHTMGVPLISGQWPTQGQMLDSVLVNESFARSISRGGDVLGRQVSGGFLNGRIAGVVSDFKYSQMDEEPTPEVYASYEEAPLMAPMTVHLFIRTSDGRPPDSNALTKLVLSVDPTQPIYAIQTLQQSLSDSIAPRRFNLFLMGVFSIAALLMALVGIYGVISYSVAQRTQEIGVRLAMGADRSHITSMVLSEGLKTSLTGIAGGILAAVILTRLMSSLLYRVRPTDPTTLVCVATLLLVTAIIACLGPAIKAAKVNPILALRNE